MYSVDCGKAYGALPCPPRTAHRDFAPTRMVGRWVSFPPIPLLALHVRRQVGGGLIELYEVYDLSRPPTYPAGKQAQQAEGEREGAEDHQ